MKTAVRYRVGLAVLLLVLIGLVALIVGRLFSGRPKEPADPHAGQVYVYDGFDWVWMTPLEGIPASTLTREDFSEINGHLSYMGDRYTTIRGVDVSEHQYEVDWDQVAASGVDFAMIRVGRRGWTEGGLFEDPWFKRNIEGALRSGLQVGVYFFSQAVNVQEAMEEARFVMERLDGYRVTLPVIFDWEKVEGVENARTNDWNSATLSDCAVAFCETIRRGGYTPGIYFNRHLGYYGFDLTRMKDYVWWFALPEMGYPSFYYEVDMWQYSFTETVPGISGQADMNLIFYPVPQAETDSGN